MGHILGISWAYLYISRGWSTLRGWPTGTRRICSVSKMMNAAKSALVSFASEIHKPNICLPLSNHIHLIGVGFSFPYSLMTILKN